MKHILVLSLILVLTGCAPYREQFDCPAGSGQACTSLYKVNRMVDRGEIGNIEAEEPMSAGLPKSLDKENSLEIFFPSHTDESGQWHGSHSVIIPRVS